MFRHFHTPNKNINAQVRMTTIQLRYSILMHREWAVCFETKKYFFSHCVSLWGSVTTNCGVESNRWCVQIILVTHNYLLISTKSKLVHTAINCTLWPFSYNTHHLIVCGMKTVDISFNEETSKLTGSQWRAHWRQHSSPHLQHDMGRSLRTSNFHLCWLSCVSNGAFLFWTEWNIQFSSNK